MLRNEPIAALAADAAAEPPRAAITFAPRPWIISRNGPCSHSSSSMTFWADSPSMRAFS